MRSLELFEKGDDVSRLGVYLPCILFPSNGNKVQLRNNLLTCRTHGNAGRSVAAQLAGWARLTGMRGFSVAYGEDAPNCQKIPWENGRNNMEIRKKRLGFMRSGSGVDGKVVKKPSKRIEY